jgi:hypothetical protein
VSGKPTSTKQGRNREPLEVVARHQSAGERSIEDCELCKRADARTRLIHRHPRRNTESPFSILTSRVNLDVVDRTKPWARDAPRSVDRKVHAS